MNHMPLGLIAGNGRFPFLALEGARRLGHALTIVAIRDETSPALEALAARLVPGRVAIRAPEPEIAALLPAYDAVVLPSVREGCPLVAIEAFAAGVPVVGYDVPGVRDALSHFGRGVLVPEADGPAGLVGALVALRGDDAARQELVSSARGAVDACAPAAVAAQLLGAYRDLAARRSD